MRILFEEQQKFTQWWLWTILIVVALLVTGVYINALYGQLVIGEPWAGKPGNDKSISDETLIAVSIINFTVMAVMIMLFYSSVLDVRVDSAGIAYTFFPLIRRERRIDRDDIRHYEIKKYYLRGYGIHYNFHGDKTINVKGTSSVEITKQNGKRLLLGTQKPEEFFHALDVMKKGSDDQ
jgi:hypothetical protein